MADENQRVDWSALMDAHGIEPDADTASPAISPDPAAAAGPPGNRRIVHIAVAVTALFSIAASVAVLVVLLRGRGDERVEQAGITARELAAASDRPAAFEQTSDGVAVVPAQTAAEPSAPAPTEPPPVARVATAKPAAKPAVAKEKRPVTEEKAAAEEAPAEEEAPPANLPDEPDQADVTAAMAVLEKDIQACAGKANVTGEVGIKMRIEPNGSVAWASAKLQNSPFQSCLDRLFKKARMPRSAKGATVRQSVTLP